MITDSNIHSEPLWGFKTTEIIQDHLNSKITEQGSQFYITAPERLLGQSNLLLFLDSASTSHLHIFPPFYLTEDQESKYIPTQVRR